MRLYLRDELSKSRGFRGGKYYTRVQTGWKADGQPSYKYFYTADDYQQWKDNKAEDNKLKTDTELKRKVEHEREEGEKYVQNKVPKANEVTGKNKGKAEEDPKKRQELLYVRS